MGITKKMKNTIDLMVTSNLNQREIAKKLDINEATISRWKNNEDFKNELGKAQKNYLMSLTAPAIRTLKNLLYADSEAVRFNAAKDILDRTGYKPTEKQQLEITPIIISGSDDLED